MMTKQQRTIAAGAQAMLVLVTAAFAVSCSANAGGGGPEGAVLTRAVLDCMAIESAICQRERALGNLTGPEFFECDGDLDLVCARFEWEGARPPLRELQHCALSLESADNLDQTTDEVLRQDCPFFP